MSLGLAALGLFGVLSYGVKLRTREFGIRMALGAERGAIRRMVLRQGLSVTAVGMAVGLVGALAASRVMASLLFHVQPGRPGGAGGLRAVHGARRGPRGVPAGPASYDGRSAHRAPIAVNGC